MLIPPMVFSFHDNKNPAQCPLSLQMIKNMFFILEYHQLSSMFFIFADEINFSFFYTSNLCIILIK